jgi:CRISPR-associated endonuclease Cas3-HD
LALLCGLHDVGKASPAFQVKVPELAVHVREAGLSWRELDGASRGWHHSLAGAFVVRRALKAAGLGPFFRRLGLAAGGRPPRRGTERRKVNEPPGRGNAQGIGPWVTVQDELVYRVTSELGIDLTAIAPSRPPRRADQLAVAGMIIMADWIASDARHFPGVDALPEVSMSGARDRARRSVPWWSEADEATSVGAGASDASSDGGGECLGVSDDEVTVVADGFDGERSLLSSYLAFEYRAGRWGDVGGPVGGQRDDKPVAFALAGEPFELFVGSAVWYALGLTALAGYVAVVDGAGGVGDESKGELPAGSDGVQDLVGASDLCGFGDVAAG